MRKSESGSWLESALPDVTAEAIYDDSGTLIGYGFQTNRTPTVYTTPFDQEPGITGFPVEGSYDATRYYPNNDQNFGSPDIGVTGQK